MPNAVERFVHLFRVHSLMKNIVNNEFGENFDSLFRHLADNQQCLTVLKIVLIRGYNIFKYIKLNMLIKCTLNGYRWIWIKDKYLFSAAVISLPGSCVFVM